MLLQPNDTPFALFQWPDRDIFSPIPSFSSVAETVVGLPPLSPPPLKFPPPNLSSPTPLKSPPAPHSPLRFFQNNVNHSNPTTHTILNSSIGHFDIILLQEPWAGRIGSDLTHGARKGHEVHGMPQQHSWTQYTPVPIVEQTRGQRQTGRNDLPGRVRGLLNGW